MEWVEPDRVAVFRGAVQLALGDGQLSNGEKRLLVKMAHALRLEENDPKRVYDAVVAGEDLATGTVLGLEETRRVYEQVLEAFLLHTDRSEDELILVAYLRHSFAIDDAEHRAIARSMDRQLEHVVHRTVAEEIRMRLDDTLDRIGTIFDEIEELNEARQWPVTHSMIFSLRFQRARTDRPEDWLRRCAQPTLSACQP